MSSLLKWMFPKPKPRLSLLQRIIDRILFPEVRGCTRGQAHGGPCNGWERVGCTDGHFNERCISLDVKTDDTVARRRRQFHVSQWCAAAFGKERSSSVKHRAVRLLEEVVEACQCADVEPAMMHKLIDYVYSRPVGTMAQELGGIGITVLALAAAAGLDADEQELIELRRVLAKPLSHFRKRNEAKNAAGFDAA